MEHTLQRGQSGCRGHVLDPFSPLSPIPRIAMAGNGLLPSQNLCFVLRSRETLEKVRKGWIRNEALAPHIPSLRQTKRFHAPLADHFVEQRAPDAESATSLGYGNPFRRIGKIILEIAILHERQHTHDDFSTSGIFNFTVFELCMQNEEARATSHFRQLRRSIS